METQADRSSKTFQTSRTPSFFHWDRIHGLCSHSILYRGDHQPTTGSTLPALYVDGLDHTFRSGALVRSQI